MLKENPIKWQEIEQQNKEQAEHNYKIFVDRMQDIKVSSSSDFETWLKNYEDFRLLFDIDFDK